MPSKGEQALSEACDPSAGEGLNCAIFHRFHAHGLADLRVERAKEEAEFFAITRKGSCYNGGVGRSEDSVAL